MSLVAVHLTVNGDEHTIRTDPTRRLLDVLRNDLGLTGAKEGCGIGECGEVSGRGTANARSLRLRKERLL